MKAGIIIVLIVVAGGLFLFLNTNNGDPGTIVMPPDSNTTSTSTDAAEVGRTMCDPENRPEICTTDYTPVCALVRVECITTPCDPVPQTFSNGCNACASDRVLSYIEGECSE